jgi:hypothetical protein
MPASPREACRSRTQYSSMNVLSPKNVTDRRASIPVSAANGPHRSRPARWAGAAGGGLAAVLPQQDEGDERRRREEQRGGGQAESDNCGIF